ncbi:MAG TPA: flagellar motor protein MotB [Symbiobacteriaceae bacterium]|jgi:chemotaxis protein MotB|nr:flagellar motor protein MotB [Symbiobacteriaceae bacterium]
MSKPTGGGGHGGSSGRWLVSYSDLMTLMMVVFMILYSMARVDSEKFEAVKASLATSLGGGSVGGTPLPVGGNPINTAPIQPGPDPDSAPGNPVPIDPVTAVPAPPVVDTAPPASDPEPEPEPPPPSKPVQTTKPPTTTPPADPLAGVHSGLNSTTAARAGQLDVQLQDRGVVVSVLTSVLFAEGKAELKPTGAALLDEISTQLKQTGESVLVEGSPDASAVEAPWDLATRRASAVVSYLVSRHGLAGDRFAVIGYGKGAGVDGIVNVVVLRRK